MKVKELIVELNNLDQDLDVIIIEYITFVGLRSADVKSVSVEIDDIDYKNRNEVSKKVAIINYG